MATRNARAPHVQQAFVLHHYDWSETSLVLDLLTREQGRMAVVAKGAKRPYSQLRSVLLPFQRLQVGLSKPVRSEDEGAPDIVTLRSAEWAGGPPLPSGAALFSAYYLNELLMKFLARQDPHPALFDAYAATLSQLHGGAEDDEQEATALRAFELRLLAEVGLLPDLSLSTTTQRALEAGRAYALLPDSGLVAAAGDAPALPGPLWIGLQAALLHGSMAALQQACRPALGPLKSQLRALLQHHLGQRPLRTRQVMLDLYKLLD